MKAEVNFAPSTGPVMTPARPTNASKPNPQKKIIAAIELARSSAGDSRRTPKGTVKDFEVRPSRA